MDVATPSWHKGGWHDPTTAELVSSSAGAIYGAGQDPALVEGGEGEVRALYAR